ncbi:Centromere/kinetochore Zw10 [Popillia japonica]|uniref:Centromere/kinetochore Zw10 n=1 Tax=Popillia japonica TaxID=7064 RepID=A0AAW1MK84_POPJA
MSFVAEIVCSAEKIAIENMDENVANILYTSDGYKQDVLQYIEEIYIKFSKRPRSNSALLNKSTTLMANISEIDKTLDEIITSDMQHSNKNMLVLYKQELIKAKTAVELGSKLIKMHEILLNMNNCVRYERYVDGIKLIKEIEGYSDDMELIQLDAFNGIINKFSVSKVILRMQLIKEYTKCIQYSATNPFTLTVKPTENIVEIFNAVGISKLELIDEFVKYLWDNMFSIIVKYKTSVNVVEKNMIKKLTVDVNDKTPNDNYNNVFENLILLTNFLNNHLDYMLVTDTTILDYIGKQIRINLSELIISSCLVNTIPTNTEELEKYTTATVKDVENLQAELIKCKIFTEDTNLIINYVKNVDVLSLNKTCAEYISRATEIMKKDLHDMVEVGREPDKSNLPSNKFPACFISKSTLELIDLSDEIRQNATTFGINAKKIYSVVRNIFQIYGSVVEHHHQKLLQTIPDQVAIFHNNCIYLSLSLLPTLFIQESYLLKRTGIRALVNSIQQQINQIEDIIKMSGLICLNALEKLDPITEKCIHQCLKQLELLQTAWHKILPQSEYNRSMGYVLNYLCNYIINAVLNTEEVSSEIRAQLVDTFKDILTRGPKIFPNPKDVHRYVKVWDRFNELVFILNSSLNEMCDRWADGNGPLALQFKPEEVQRLIRTLFPNNDRRVTLLAKTVK